MKVDSQLVEGFMSRVKARDFEIIVDQNKGMGGTNQAPRPSEWDAKRNVSNNHVAQA